MARRLPLPCPALIHMACHFPVPVGVTQWKSFLHLRTAMQTPTGTPSKRLSGLGSSTTPSACAPAPPHAPRAAPSASPQPQQPAVPSPGPGPEMLGERPSLGMYGVPANSDSDDEGPALRPAESESLGAAGAGVDALLCSAAGTARGHSSDIRHAAKRWVPFKQVNGVAIYRHKPDDEPSCAVGGEAAPWRCFGVLGCLHCNHSGLHQTAAQHALLACCYPCATTTFLPAYLPTCLGWDW